MEDRRTFSLIVAVSLTGLLLACTPDFDSQSLVNKFRILAIKADPVAGSPGQTITLTPLLSDSQFGRFPILVWLTCTPLPGQTGLQCLESGEAGQISLSETLTVTLPELGEDEDEKDLDVILLACAGTPQVPDFERGDYDFCDSPESDIAVRTITVARETPNFNPAIIYLTFTSPETGSLVPSADERTVLDCTAGCSDFAFQLTLADISVETYTVERFGEVETLRENTFISWYATAGEFSDSRTYEGAYTESDEIREDLVYDVSWTPPEEGGDVTFYFVAYDGRGGVDYIVREAHVLAPAEGP